MRIQMSKTCPFQRNGKKSSVCLDKMVWIRSYWRLGRSEAWKINCTRIRTFYLFILSCDVWCTDSICFNGDNGIVALFGLHQFNWNTTILIYRQKGCGTVPPLCYIRPYGMFNTLPLRILNPCKYPRPFNHSGSLKTVVWLQLIWKNAN